MSVHGCRYKAVSFWQFLLSSQKDVDAFAVGASSPGRRDPDLYSPGFEPPHWKRIRERYVVHLQPEAAGLPIIISYGARRLSF
jgi:hypothetical protein